MLRCAASQVGASNLGHIILYGILNQGEGLLCDRAYFPGRLGWVLLVAVGGGWWGMG